MKNKPEVQFLRLPEVMYITSLSKSRIYELIRQGSFPKQIPLGNRSVVWTRHSVQNWCNELIAAAA